MQKFKHGDWVQICDVMPESMSHFASGKEAIVIGSYKDQFGGSDDSSYTLFIKGNGKCSWYLEEQIILIETNRLDLLDSWETIKEQERKLHSDLDWIFSNLKDVPWESFPSASIESLGRCLGINNLWGRSGEGFVYYQNSIRIWEICHLWIDHSSKESFLSMIKELRENKDKGNE